MLEKRVAGATPFFTLNFFFIGKFNNKNQLYINLDKNNTQQELLKVTLGSRHNRNKGVMPCSITPCYMVV